jgi:hypothetical protein
MNEAIYLVFGDLHGRVLPAFRLTTVWGREHGVRVAGILQVGDLGYFPDLSRLDSATRRYAADDPLELGVQLVTQPSPEADAVFGDPDVPEALWFTAGNHEDHEALQQFAHGSASTFAVDAYLRVACIRDGHVATLPGPLRVGALWGIDGSAPRARTNIPPRSRIHPRSATQLSTSSFDVLLTHDSARDAVVPGAGSEEIADLIRMVQPAFAFFGHHKGRGRQVQGDFGRTQVFHLAGMELRHRGLYPEEGCVGVLTWDGQAGTFAFVDNAWLRTFTRDNWRSR